MPDQMQTSGAMKDIVTLQSDFLSGKTLESRKELGQYFTGQVVSDYMASLVARLIN